MNNNTTLVLVAATLAFAGFASMVSAAYGDYVTEDSSEWTVALSDAYDAPVEGGDIIRHGAGTANNFFDDVFVLDLDADGDISQYDLVLATEGYDGTAVGELITDEMDLLIGNGAFFETGSVPTIDASENGRFDDEDFAFICNVATLTATESADDGDFCIALTDADGLSPGDLVRTSDDVLDDWDGIDSGDMDDATFCIFDADEDDEFQGDDDGDLAWIVDSTDCNLANDNVLPNFSIEVFGDSLSYGAIVTDGSNAFTSTIKTDFGTTAPAESCLDDGCGTVFTVYRHGAGTANNFFDDVVVYDLDVSGDVSQFDQVLASSGYDGSEAGGVIEDDMTLLNGDTEGEFACDLGVTFVCDVFVYDANEDGKYNTDDAVVFCVTDDLASTGVFATEAASGGNFCVYLVGYSDASAGDFVRTGDDLIDDFGGDEFALGDLAQLVYFDNDDDDVFEADEDSDMSWIDLTGAATGATLPRYSIELFGGDFGTQVDASEAIVRVLLVGAVTGLSVYRDDAGTANNFFDDVFVLDLNDNGELDQFDFVLATSGYDGTEVGGLIEDGMTLIIDDSPTDEGAEIVTIDVDENGNFNEGDGVFVCDTADLEATDEDDYCVALTDAEGLSPGDLVRTSDDVLDDWADNEDARAGADVCYYNSDNDALGEFEGDEDLAWLAVFGCDDDDFVGLHWIELYGEFGTLGGGGSINTRTNTVSVSSSSTSSTNGTVSVSTSTGPAVTTSGVPPTGSDGQTSTDEDNNSTPGFELVALVGALAVALILVRRKL